MERKKILWLCSWYPSPATPYNGDFIRRHAEAVAAFHDVHVIHAWAANGPVSLEQGVRLTTPGLTEKLVPYPYRGGAAWKRLFNHRAWKRSMKQALLDYEKQHGKPDLVHVQVALKAGIWARWIQHHWQVPYLLSEHSSAFLPGTPENWRHLPFWYRRILRGIIENAAGCSVVSGVLREGFLNGFPQASVRIIPNVVNTKIFKPGSDARHPRKFIHISGLQPLKNPVQILEAFAIYAAASPGAELWMVGAEAPELQRHPVMNVLQGRVHFLPEIPQPDLAALLQTCTALVLYSDYESFGCVMIEALACGVPVIAADRPVFRERIEEGVNGILVPPDNVVWLARAFERMEKASGALSSPVTIEAVRARYGYEAVGLQFSAWYREVIAGASVGL